ncbi:hypothetical protein AcV5_001965 [Taiwanofungus camphoratus]|nr:hypothetical protein AcV5_001965 [Antrodia cinnamomea]
MSQSTTDRIPLCQASIHEDNDELSDILVAIDTETAPEQEVDGEEEPKKRKRNTELALELDITEDGKPLLPSQEVISVVSLNQKKQLIAQFVHMHYEDITLKDCTKMIQTDVDRLLNFWSDWQDDPEVDYTFKFKA